MGSYSKKIPSDSKLYQVLKRTWAYPIVVLMKGGWRLGKTSTSLLMALLSKQWGLIDKIGSNIWTWHNPEIDYIISLQGLRGWLHADKTTKLFLFDEALKHMYRRKAMSKKSIAMITDILPEISKGHGRMIVISQIDKIDSDMIDPVFCRSVWEKRSKKTMFCVSKHHKPITFHNLPDSPIRFDPDRLAPFINKEVSKKTDLKGLEEIYQIAHYYGKGESITWIKRKMDLHQEQVKRQIRKALLAFCEHEDEKRRERAASIEGQESVTLTE